MFLWSIFELSEFKIFFWYQISVKKLFHFTFSILISKLKWLFNIEIVRSNKSKSIIKFKTNKYVFLNLSNVKNLIQNIIKYLFSSPIFGDSGPILSDIVIKYYGSSFDQFKVAQFVKIFFSEFNIKDSKLGLLKFFSLILCNRPN